MPTVPPPTHPANASSLASEALLGRIAQATLTEFGLDDLYIAEPPPGMVLGAAHLELLQRLEEDRLDDPGSVGRLVELSRIVDTIQSGEERLVPPGQARGFVSDMFARIEANVKFLSAPLDERQQRAYAAALATLYEAPSEEKIIKTPGYADFCQLRVEVEKKEPALLLLRHALSQESQPERRAALEVEVSDLEALLREQREALEALDRAGGFSQAERVITDSEIAMDEFPSSVRRELESMLLIEAPASGATHVVCSFFPSALSEDSWAPLKLTQADLEKAFAGDEAAEAEAGALSAQSIESVEVEIQTLRVERPWFWPALFESRNWTWRAPSLPISTGQPSGDGEALLPAYVYALVFARNLTVHQKPSAPESPVALDISAFAKGGLLSRALIAPVAEAEAKPATASGVSFRPEVLPKLQLMARPIIASTLVQGRAMPAKPAAVQQIAKKDLVTVRAAMPVTKSINPALIEAVRGQKAAALHVLDPKTRRPISASHNKRLAVANRGYTVSGKIVDEAGRGIAGARIALSGKAQRFTTAGAGGAFTFQGLPAGGHSVVVTRRGFQSTRSAMAVPQGSPLTFVLKAQGVCQLTVNLTTAGGPEAAPFIGRAQLLIENAEGRRLESMTNRSVAVLALPAGQVTLQLTAPEAAVVSPSSLTLTLTPGQHLSQTFVIVPSNTLQNPGVQLLAFVCRRVPASP